MYLSLGVGRPGLVVGKKVQVGHLYFLYVTTELEGLVEGWSIGWQAEPLDS